MGKKNSSSHTDNLSISRIHVILRPFETKLNALVKTLSDRKVAENKYAPSHRLRGITYSKRHRIRAVTGMSVRQASRAYALEKSQGLSTRFGFHEQVIGVEDAFRNLVRATHPTITTQHQERVLSLQAMLSKMIGRQVAEETLRDKDELEAEGIDDCIGLWYGNLTVHCRKDALVAHAIELVALKIPVFILELWKGLLTITLQAHLLEESTILLEDILLYHLTPENTSNPHVHTSGRDLTDLYTLFAAHLPATDFFSILLPILENSPPTTWRIRAVQHLIRHVDNDLAFTCRLLERAAVASCYHINSPISGKSTTTQDSKWLLKQIEVKVFSVLGVLITDGVTVLDNDVIWENMHLSWTLWVLGQHLRRHTEEGESRVTELACALDLQMLLLSSRYSPAFDTSEIIHRLFTPKLVNGPNTEKLFSVFLQALKLFEPRPQGSKNPNLTPNIDTYCLILLECGLDELAERLRNSCEQSEGASVYADLATDLASLKRKWMGQDDGFSKSRKLGNGKKAGPGGRRKSNKRRGDSEEESETVDSDSEEEAWSASVSGEDTAGEVDQEEEDEEDSLSEKNSEHTDAERSITEDEDDVDRTFTQKHSLRLEDDEEEDFDGTTSDLVEDELDHRNLILQPSNRFLPLGTRGPAPVLQSVVNAKLRTLMHSRLNHTSRESIQEEDDEEEEEEEYIKNEPRRGHQGHSRQTLPSSDDDLDLLGADASAWSTP